MKAVERGTIKYLVILIVATALCGIVLYPLFDFLYYKFITHSEFVYSVHSYLIQPIIFGCVFGTTFWAVDKNRK